MLAIIATALVLVSGMRIRHFRQLGKGRGQALELEWGVPARSRRRRWPSGRRRRSPATLGVFEDPLKFWRRV